MKIIDGKLLATEIRADLKVKIENTSDAFEAFGFAILGHMTMLKKPSNVRSVTGAKHAVILGNVTYPPIKE